MVIQYQGHDIPTCFASCSIPGQFKASLPQKLEAIRNAGFDAVEMSMPDILDYGHTLDGKTVKEDDFDAIAAISRKIRMFTDEIGLGILMLQPFSRFEGWSKQQHIGERMDAFRRARGWIQVMEALGTDMLQVRTTQNKHETETHALHDRLDRPMRMAFLHLLMYSRPTWENWQTCWRRKGSVSHMRIGVGQPMPPAGRMSGI